MEFPDGLRAAIAASGLSLEELAERLGKDGQGVSTSSLSAWQSGLSRPVRAASLRALSDLEVVLGVAPGSLAALLTEQEPRRRRADDKTRDAGVWDYREVFDRLLAKMGAVYDDPAEPERLSRHLRVQIAADGSHRRLTVSGLVRGRRQPSTRLFFFSFHGSLPQVPAVVHTHGLTLNRFRGESDHGITVQEFLLDRPLAHGEVASVGFTIAYPPRFQSNFISARNRHHYRDIILDVHFDPARLPSRCWAYHQIDPQGEERVLHELDGGRDGTAFQLVRLDPGPGTHGIRWEFPPESTQQSR
ncbi:helix-turn-helix domain-containing protein [Nocardioides speluncae]|uniref:helix-turn-helix domain-containing protein n=1 Tax=Nocardioides speluncae TaxID=2670337 RepID=UPI0012B166CA|nr:helix-turn-helix transcriptional regulator [Nocardioides speluncae]